MTSVAWEVMWSLWSVLSPVKHEYLISCASYKWHFEEKPLLSPDACFSLSSSDYKEDRGDGAGDGGVSLFTVEHMAAITVWGGIDSGLLNIPLSVLSLFSLLFLFLTPHFSSPRRLTLMLFTDWHCLSFQDPFWPYGRKRNQPNISFFSYLFVYFPKPDCRFV